MKLKNKKTGEIADLEHRGLLKSDNNNHIIVYPEGTLKYYAYNSLAELNEEWEDYEEPYIYYFIDIHGEIKQMEYHKFSWQEEMKEIGNYFENKEEAKLAVRKLKAWKRLKDKGFRFEYYDYSDRDLHNHIQIKAITNREVEDSMLYKEDLDLLFGGEE